MVVIYASPTTGLMILWYIVEQECVDNVYGSIVYRI